MQSGLVELRDRDGAPVLLAPQGTRARVLAWPAEFVGAASEPLGRILVQVKVTTGPAQGRAFAFGVWAGVGVILLGMAVLGIRRMRPR
ncbi:hypothetical protein [Micromonospora sp. CPCC 206061]|uniref:hypothetical protein n=1 Tax=Micromonospora sp. CPCC 206061 TaxID=3122410 RepID=UPI002FF1452D